LTCRIRQRPPNTAPGARRCWRVTNSIRRCAPRVNPYLLRFYFLVAGMTDEEFLRRIRATGGSHG
jgi:hypothetical protein